MALEVELTEFNGPLDLLLSLIEKNKVNIFDIPIVEITDQYLAYVRKMEEENLEIMSEFMVMAAELIAIKCRMLLPEEEEEESSEADPREELVRKLLEYKAMRARAEKLRDFMDDAFGRIFKDDTVPPEVKKYRPPVNPEEIVGDLTLKKLNEIFENVLRRQADKIDPLRSRFGTIEKETVSLPEQLEKITEYVRKHRTFSFRKLLSEQHSRMRTVVTFLAVLELMNYGLIRASQNGPEDDIEIERNDEADVESIRKRFTESEFTTLLEAEDEFPLKDMTGEPLHEG